MFKSKKLADKLRGITLDALLHNGTVQKLASEGIERNIKPYLIRAARDGKNGTSVEIAFSGSGGGNSTIKPQVVEEMVAQLKREGLKVTVVGNRFVVDW